MGISIMENATSITKIINDSISTTNESINDTKIFEGADSTLISDLNGYIPLEMSVGSSINGYSVVRVLRENTGEATILVVSRDGCEFIMKIYHKGKHQNKELIEIINSIDSQSKSDIIDVDNSKVLKHSLSMKDSKPITESMD